MTFLILLEHGGGFIGRVQLGGPMIAHTKAEKKIDQSRITFSVRETFNNDSSAFLSAYRLPVSIAYVAPYYRLDITFSILDRRHTPSITFQG